MRLIVDTDGGVDDAVALWWALTAPDAEVLGITVVHGNVAVDQAAANVCRILEAAGRPDIPVAVGPTRRSGPRPSCGRPTSSTGPMASATRTARRRVRRRASGRRSDLFDSLVDEDVVVVTLGPLTNLGCPPGRRPRLGGARPARLVVMGGTVLGAGNADAVG